MGALIHTRRLAAGLAIALAACGTAVALPADFAASKAKGQRCFGKKATIVHRGN